MIGYSLFILFFLQGSSFALSINEKSDNLSLDSKKNFNDTIQSNQKVLTQILADGPTITYKDVKGVYKKIFNGNLGQLSISYKESVVTAEVHKVTTEVSCQKGDQFIMLNDNTLASDKYSTKEIDKVQPAADAVKNIELLVIKQSTSGKVTCSIQTIGYKEEAKSTAVKSLVTPVEGAGPAAAVAPNNPDYEISFTNTGNTAKPEELAFKKSGNGYTAEFAVNVKVTAKKEMPEAVLEFYLSNKMGDATVTYKLVKPTKDDGECNLIFPDKSPASDMTGATVKPYVGGSVYYLKCKYAVFAANAVKEHKIIGKVTTAGKTPLTDDTKLGFGLIVTLNGKTGNSPWAYALSSKSPKDSTTTTGNTKKGLSKGAIAGIVIGVLLAVGIVVGLVIFFMKKKQN